MKQFLQDYFLLERMGGELLRIQYDLTLVVLSYIVIVFAAYTTLNLVLHMRNSYAENQSSFVYWLLGAAFTLGGGIFVMHFIAMLAFSIPVQVTYDFGMTLLSIVVAVTVSCVALYNIRKEKLSIYKVAVAALLMGLGVASMHYIGMAAVLAPAMLRYAPSIWVISIIIAIVVSFVAILLLYYIPKLQSRFIIIMKLVTAMIMGVAAAGMHYTAMAAANFYSGGYCGVTTNFFAIEMEHSQLATTLAVVSLSIIAIGLIASIFNEKINTVLGQKSQELEEIIASMQDALVVTDSNSIIIQTNPKLTELTGYNATELQNRDLGILFVEEEEEEEAVDNYLKCKDGTIIPVSISRASLTFSSEEDKGDVIIIHDLRERIKIEKERENAAVAKESAYQAGVAEMSATVLHNIGNAVNPLIEYSYQLGQDGKDVEKMAGIVEDAYNDAKMVLEHCPKNNEDLERLLNIINALPDALRKHYQKNLSGHLGKLDIGITHIADIVRVQQNLVKDGVGSYVETFDLKATIDDAISLISTSLETRGIKTELNIQIVDITLPRNPFIQMINNLIKNAQEAIEISNNAGNGVIKIKATPETNNKFCLTIKDNGCGIESEKQKDIFNFGYTDKELGSGFGLHSAANFIQSQGGKIEVMSEGKDKGVIFTIILPIGI